MKKITKKTILVSLFISCFTVVTWAQNFYTETPTYYAGFENTSALYVGNQPTPANSYSVDILTEMPFAGTRSFKGYCANAALPTGGNSTVILGGNDTQTPAYAPGNVSLSAGSYIFKAKIYTTDQTPKNIVIYIVEKTAGITTGVNLIINLETVTAGSWQTIQGSFSIAAAAEYKTGIRLRGIDYAGKTGTSTFYIDNMEIISDTSTGIQDVKNNSFLMSVLSDKIVITPNEQSNISIFNLAGSKIYEAKSVNKFIEISTNNFNKGLYFATVENEKGISTQKFIVR